MDFSMSSIDENQTVRLHITPRNQNVWHRSCMSPRNSRQITRLFRSVFFPCSVVIVHFRMVHKPFSLLLRPVFNSFNAASYSGVESYACTFCLFYFSTFALVQVLSFLNIVALQYNWWRNAIMASISWKLDFSRSHEVAVMTAFCRQFYYSAT